MNIYLRQRKVVWRMIHKYGLQYQQALCALILLKEVGLMSAARFCWHAHRAAG